MPIIGPVSGFDYTAKWGIDVGKPAPIQMGARPPSHADWEAFPDEIKALFGLPDWATYQKYQQAYEQRAAPGGDIHQEKERAAQLLFQAKPKTWAEARNVLLQNGFDPNAQASGPLFKELEILWNGGAFAAGGHGGMVQSPGGGLDALAAWLPGLGQGLAQQYWMQQGTSSMEGYDPNTGTYWNRRPDGQMEYFDWRGQPLSGPPSGFNPGLAQGQMPMGIGGMGGMGGMMGMGGIFGELSQQMHLDTLMQQFMYEKAAREYGEALPLESFYQDMLGDILGVDFQKPQFSLNEYFQRGLQGVGGNGFRPGIDGPGLGPPVGWATAPPGFQKPGQPGTDTNPNLGGGGADGNSPQDPDEPLSPMNFGGAIPYAPASDPSGKPLPFLPADNGPAAPPPGLGEVSSMVIGDREGPYNAPGNLPPNQGGPPRPPGGGGMGGGVEHGPATPGALGRINDILAPQRPGGGGGMIPGMPGGGGPIPQTPFPTLNGKGYTLKSGPAMDLADQRTFGLLAPQINRMMEDVDGVLERYKQELPMGGERSAGIADILRGAQGDIYGMRGDLLQQALSGVAGLSGAKKGYNPAGYSGSGQALLGDQTARRGQDIQNSQFGQNLAFERDALSQQLKAQRDTNKSNLWGSLLGGVGGLMGLLSDERAKENITPHKPGLKELSKVQTHEWDYLPEFGGAHDYGVVAQELELVLPDAVSQVGGLKMINPMHLLATTINAIKELQIKVEALNVRPAKKGSR